MSYVTLCSFPGVLVARSKPHGVLLGKNLFMPPAIAPNKPEALKVNDSCHAIGNGELIMLASTSVNARTSYESRSKPSHLGYFKALTASSARSSFGSQCRLLGVTVSSA